MIVRRIGTERWRIARAVRLEALAESRSGVFGSAVDVTSAWTKDQWLQWMQRQTLFVCEADSCLLGSAGGVFDSDDVAGLASVWVRPSARGIGVSDLLLGAVADWARAKGHDHLQLWFTEDNTHAELLYLRHGFTRTGNRRPAMDAPSVNEVQMSMPLRSSPARASRVRSELGVRLRLLRPGDEQQFLAVRARLHADGFEFAKNYRGPWTSYLDRLERTRRGADLDPGTVPSTFLMAVNATGQIIGSSDIRHQLTDQLAHWGGHIGYVVVPERRGIGYGTQILRQTLPRAKALGIHHALLTCRSDNIASRRVITICGGELDTITDDGICQYWLPT